MSKKASAPIRQYTDELKVEAVRLAESIGGNQVYVKPGQGHEDRVCLGNGGASLACLVLDGQARPRFVLRCAQAGRFELIFELKLPRDKETAGLATSDRELESK